jgi:tripartite-type tricarboxylate transporter receptor subunit TctC
MNRKSISILMAALLLSGVTAAEAQQFAGKDVTMVVNYTAGGPTDIEAHMVAGFLPEHLKGVRSIIVRNVGGAGGAGGAIGVNQLGASSQADRFNLGFFTWDPMDQLIENSILTVKYKDLKFIAGFRPVSLVYIRPDTPPGPKRSADVVRTPPVKVGVLSPATMRRCASAWLSICRA